jgi:alkaline phosphatase D
MSLFALFAFLLAFCSPSLATSVADGPITHGPIAGGVTDDAIVLWARAPSVTVYAEYSLAGQATWSQTAQITTVSSNAYRAQWTISGLEPETEYDLRICGIGGPCTRIVTVGTAPEPSSIVDSRIVVLADSLPTTTSEVWASAGALDPDYALIIGDWDHSDPGTMSSPPVLNNWRWMHRYNLGEKLPGYQYTRGLVDLGVPLSYVWDDHDYGGNNFGASFAQKGLARQAYSEFHPHAPFPDGATGAIYHTLRWGQVEVWMLDSRWYREAGDPVCGSGATMLGPEQRMWLLEGLWASDAVWKVVVSPSVWNPTLEKEDSWYSYPDERQTILDLVTQAGISGVVVVSGDIHSVGLLDDGSNSGLPEMSVPPINIDPPLGGCTANGSDHADCGDWSVPWSEGPHPGFGVIDATYDAITGHELTLSIVRFDGVVRRTLVCTPAGGCL